MNRHPYHLRRWFRERLPWFLIDAGFAAKGKDCEEVLAEHKWYNMDNERSGCYYCKIIKEGNLWKKNHSI
nr:hypothetical protein [uncultured Fluviicola sp.]